MKRQLFFFLFLIGTAAYAQKPVTTFILLRHAEKANDATADPELSEAGKKRAQSLAKFLAKTKVTAIYSTAYKRTRSTVAPLAKAKGLTVGTYNPAKPEELDAMIQKYSGGIIVIVGHSNTTPALINFLTGHENEYKTFDDSEYGNLVIVPVTERGRDVKVIWLTY
jgi:2,3-bisphosphoglycerate-dependent phosphoglycerate mutase